MPFQEFMRVGGCDPVEYCMSVRDQMTILRYKEIGFITFAKIKYIIWDAVIFFLH